MANSSRVNMELSRSQDKQHSFLQADYLGPDNSKAFVERLAPPSAVPSTKSRTAYLSSLRGSITKMQTDINTFLTQEMESEKQNPNFATKHTQEAENEEEGLNDG